MVGEALCYDRTRRGREHVCSAGNGRTEVVYVGLHEANFAAADGGVQPARFVPLELLCREISRGLLESLRGRRVRVAKGCREKQWQEGEADRLRDVVPNKEIKTTVTRL